MSDFIYPAGDQQTTPNIGLATWGMDEVLADNMILIDNAISQGSGDPSFIDVVTQFGADNTGLTSAVSAIEKALAAASSSGSIEKASVYFPAGTYLIDSTITLSTANNGIRLFGSAPVLSGGSLGNAAQFKAGSVFKGPFFSNYGNSSTENVTFENLSFNGNGKASIGLYLDGTILFEIKGNEFIGFTSFGTSTVTGTSVSSEVVTVETVNSLNENDVVALYGLTTSTYLNGAALTVLTASSSQFTATLPQHFTSGNYSTVSDTGTVLKMGACIYGGSNLYSKIHDNIFHGVTDCYSLLLQSGYGSVAAYYGLNDGWIERNNDYTSHFMRVGGDCYFNQNDFEGAPLVGCNAAIDQSDATTDAGNCKTSVSENYFELSTAATNPAAYRRAVYFTSEALTADCINNTMFGGSIKAGVTRVGIETNVELFSGNITGNSIRNWDTGIALNNPGVAGAEGATIFIAGNYTVATNLVTGISNGQTSSTGRVYSTELVQSDRMYVTGASLSLYAVQLGASDTSIDLSLSNLFEWSSSGSTTTLATINNAVAGGFFTITASVAGLTLQNGTTRFNLACGGNYTMQAGQSISFVVAYDGKVWEVGCQSVISQITGFGNGSSATAVTTTALGTGSGPTTPQTVASYMKIELGGTVYWVPLMQ